MRKVLVIGIDGLDPGLLARWGDELPAFRKLEDRGTKIELKSIYPIDSIPAWASIYTGLTPAKHGILHTTDYLDTRHQPKDIDSSFLPGRTFWDFAGKLGKKVCIVNPFLAYPAWEVNGIMVSGPVFTRGKPQAFPPLISQKYKLPHLGGVVERYPARKELGKFYEKMRKITVEEAEFGLKILRENDWDLAFICFTTLDGVKHFFWRYFDENDPTYPGDTPYQDAIKNFYQLFDEIVGRLAALEPETIIVLSDHGHGMRSTKLINLSKVLVEAGFLIPRSRSIALIPKLQSNVLAFINQFTLSQRLLGEIVRLIPAVKKLKQSSVNFKRSRAYVSELGGMKPFGGIIISKEVRESDYESLRTAIIKQVAEIKDPDTGERLVEWICRREEMFSGEYVANYPDIILELREGYGINWSLHDPFKSTHDAHTTISGGHKRDAVLLINNKKSRKIITETATSVDIAPTILNLLDIKGDFNFDGRSIFE